MPIFLGSSSIKGFGGTGPTGDPGVIGAQGNLGSPGTTKGNTGNTGEYIEYVNSDKNQNTISFTTNLKSDLYKETPLNRGANPPSYRFNSY